MPGGVLEQPADFGGIGSKSWQLREDVAGGFGRRNGGNDVSDQRTLWFCQLGQSVKRTRERERVADGFAENVDEMGIGAVGSGEGFDEGLQHADAREVAQSFRSATADEGVLVVLASESDGVAGLNVVRVFWNSGPPVLIKHVRGEPLAVDANKRIG